MKYNEGLFQGAGGVNLYYQSWHPQTEVRGVLSIVHGLGSHSSSYGNIVEHLIPRSYAIYTFDLRGHGRSDGQRGHINSWEEIRTDLKAFLQLVETQLPNLPQFILGHSMGGVVVLDYVMRFCVYRSSLFGAITLAPAVGKLGISPFKLTIGKILSRVLPRFTLSTGLKLDTGARDEKVLAAYAEDKLRHTRGSARLSTEFIDTVNWIHAHIEDLQIPLLIIQGGADTVTLPEGSRQFFQKVTFPDKELLEYPEAYHEIQDDFGYEQVMADLGSWLERHLSPTE
ncbi:alpha/beta hydrolase [Mastigocoleus testarum]|uniref:Lysophospholipase n=1 Tax=Mastigocoleus testarum BC008 TaxID=371196 RepID=A0A0V7ZVL8_9CYAN|nr:alpha/beta hydrolase [Mastigocoleus testarum]KST68670.1 lysophospholipase [Mastigocoleus testarum BC008]KST68684.1 lysophospholipase [Mastigocoleus testarum BC008]